MTIFHATFTQDSFRVDPSGPSHYLTDKVTKWCARADDLANNPSLDPSAATLALRSLGDLQKQVARSRLSESTPLTKALKSIKLAYQPAEETVKSARMRLSRHTASRTPQPNFLGVATADVFEDLLSPRDDLPHDDNPVLTVLPVEIDLNSLALNALRAHFSDHALRTAVNKHLRETEKANLTGVTYRGVVSGSQLDCAVIR